jgi:ABC-type transporter Mla MlaB component
VHVKALKENALGTDSTFNTPGSPFLELYGRRRFIAKSTSVIETESLMASVRPNRHDGNGKRKTVRVTRTQVELDRSPATIDVGRSGGWMPAEDLRKAALDALVAGMDLTLDLDGIDHLDASALQILLALDAEQKKRERNLQLTNASPGLRKWFEFAGVVDRFSMTGQECDE